MELSGGEPDVVNHDKKTGEPVFMTVQPKSRTVEVFVATAKHWSQKEHKPEDSANHVAAAMGIELLTEEQYRELQKVGKFDTKRQAG
jgi:hypothetical protein